MHDDQVHIDGEIARRLIHSQFPRYRREQIVPVAATGTVNAIFRIGSKDAARFPLRAMNPADCAALLRAEAAAMKELGVVSPYPTPQPIALGEPGSDYPMPWAIQSWIEGETATSEGLSGSNVFALDLARLVAALRRSDARGRRFDGRGRGGTLADHDDWMEKCFARSEHLLDVAELRALWAELRTLPPAGPEVMSHKDLIPANLLVQGERLVGVLDGGDFGPADRSLDLVAGWHLLDRERRTILRSALNAGALEWKRGMAWAFQQAMGLVWYYRTTNPAMSALGRSTIARILDEVKSGDVGA